MAKWTPKVKKMEKKSRYKPLGEKSKGPTALPNRDASNLHSTDGQGIETTQVDPRSAIAVKRYAGKQMVRNGK